MAPATEATMSSACSPECMPQELPEDEGWLCPACDAKVCPARPPFPLEWSPSALQIGPLLLPSRAPPLPINCHPFPLTGSAHCCKMPY